MATPSFETINQKISGLVTEMCRGGKVTGRAADDLLTRTLNVVSGRMKELSSYNDLDLHQEISKIVCHLSRFPDVGSQPLTSPPSAPSSKPNNDDCELSWLAAGSDGVLSLQEYQEKQEDSALKGRFENMENGSSATTISAPIVFEGEEFQEIYSRVIPLDIRDVLGDEQQLNPVSEPQQGTRTGLSSSSSATSSSALGSISSAWTEYLAASQRPHQPVHPVLGTPTAEPLVRPTPDPVVSAQPERPPSPLLRAALLPPAERSSKGRILVALALLIATLAVTFFAMSLCWPYGILGGVSMVAQSIIGEVAAGSMAYLPAAGHAVTILSTLTLGLSLIALITDKNSTVGKCARVAAMVSAACLSVFSPFAIHDIITNPYLAGGLGGLLGAAEVIAMVAALRMWRGRGARRVRCVQGMGEPLLGAGDPWAMT